MMWIEEDYGKTQLTSVYDGMQYLASDPKIKEIYLAKDGHGPMGYYDRVHVVFHERDEIILPAHQCQHFTKPPKDK